jgi:CMP/dCMP kinase
MIITIDGPAASGKSSVARALAVRLNFYYLYTGLLYRAVAYLLAVKYGVDFFSSSCSGPFKIDSNDLNFIKNISYEYLNGKPKVLFEGKDIAVFLHGVEMDQLSSMIAAHNGVRFKLLILQRKIGKEYDIVADGRDCGTVVFPNAEYKFFLTATKTMRVQRIFSSFQRNGERKTVEKIEKELNLRDNRDINREVAPLKISDGAIVVDNSDMTLTETIEFFLSKINIPIK